MAEVPDPDRHLEFAPRQIQPVLAVGDTAPDFTLPDQDGSDVRLSELRGQTVVLYFYPRADAG